MNPVTQRGLPGSRPEGALGETEAAARVREMFGRIAPRYDLLNHLLSFHTDKQWRRRVARMFADVLHDPHARVLDLCCGTGDLALAFRKEAPAGAEITGADFVPEMLVRARAKAAAIAMAVEFVEADALQLPFPGGQFDLVSCAFGFRNLVNYERGLVEIFRVLKPGGAAAILEFSEPTGMIFGPMFRFYFTRVLPRLGGWISGDASAYAYLPNSVRKFPNPEELQLQFEGAGFRNVRFKRWTGGVVALHTARKP